MAYIDKDKVIQLLRTDVAKYYPTTFLNGILASVREIEKMSTEDVVTRSEYEELEFQFKELDIECDRLEKVETDFYEAVKQVKQEVAKKLTRQIRMAIMAHGTKYAMKELAKIEKEYMGE